MKRAEFQAFLERHRAGGLLDRVAEDMGRVIAGVKQTGKTGSLTIKLVVKPTPRGSGAVYVTDEVKHKAPEVESEASFWFATEGGSLALENPDQRTLQFDVVAAPAPAAAAAS